MKVFPIACQYPAMIAFYCVSIVIHYVVAVLYSRPRFFSTRTRISMQ